MFLGHFKPCICIHKKSDHAFDDYKKTYGMCTLPGCECDQYDESSKIPRKPKKRKVSGN